MPGLRDEEKVGLSEEEIAALEAEMSDDERAHAASQSGEDDGEDAGTTRSAATGAEDDAQGKEGDAASVDGQDDGAAQDGAASSTAADDTAVVEEAAAEITPPFSAPLPVAPVEDYEVKRGALLDQRKDLRQKYRDGEVDADDYDNQLDEINDKIARLDRENDQALFAEQANNNIAQARYVWTINQFKATVKEKEGIDYDTNPGLMNAWDLQVKKLAQAEENADKTAEWFLREAHKIVVTEIRAAAAALGLGEKKDDPKPSDQKKVIDGKVKQAVEERRPDTSKAKSLATVPSAESSRESEGEFAHLDGLNGMELERAVAKLSPEQQERWSNS